VAMHPSMLLPLIHLSALVFPCTLALSCIILESKASSSFAVAQTFKTHVALLGACDAMESPIHPLPLIYLLLLHFFCFSPRISSLLETRGTFKLSSGADVQDSCGSVASLQHYGIPHPPAAAHSPASFAFFAFPLAPLC